MEQDLKTEKRQLRYDFTASEVHDFSLELATKNKEFVRIENESKAVASQYGSKLKTIKSEIAELSNKVSDGWELREIECDVAFHKPTQGMKTVTRKDNGRTYTEKMESYEWNLFTQAEESGEDEDFSSDVEIVDGPKLIGG